MVRTMIVMIMLMKSIHEHKTSWEIEDGDEQESQVIRMVSELPIYVNAPEKRIPSQLQGSKILEKVFFGTRIPNNLSPINGNIL